MSTELEESVVADIEANSEAYENLLVLTDDIGPRVAGSPGERRACEFLAATLRRYELDAVEVEAFTHRAWRPEREALQVLTPSERPLACRCAGLSPSTPAAGVEGELVFLDRCDREELETRREEIPGRIVVAPYYPYARQLKTPLAARYGAAALLEHRTYPGGLQPARTCAFARVGELPVASISLEDALYLQRLQTRRGPVRVRLTLDSRVAPATSWNVVGALRGRTRPEEQIVMGGHYDTWHVGPGAIDNAAGVVAVLEAARALARQREQLQRTVRFVCFGVEESGLVGSWSYCLAHAAELDGMLVMVNNDVGGRPASLGIAGCEALRQPLEVVAARTVVQDRTEPLEVRGGAPSWGSDHFPFMAHGVPTVGLGTESVRPEDRLYGHSRGDTADKVYPRGLVECAAIDARIACHMDSMPERPAPRLTREETERYFVEHDFGSTLELLDLWPPERVVERYLQL